MNSNFDILCIGNSLIDIFSNIQDDNRHVKFDEETHTITLQSGDKINLDGYKLSLGGSASNVSVGLSRLGLRTGVMSDIGDDEFANKILNIFKKESVNTEFVKQNVGSQTSLSFILDFKKEKTIFVEHILYDHDFDVEKIDTNWIYLTSLGKKWGSVYEKVLESVEKNNANLVLNPGSLEIESQGDLLFKAVSKTNILFLNKEEANQLAQHSDREMIDLLRDTKKLGAKIVVITDGRRGSYAMNEKGESFYLNSFPSNIVDPTGAGDAYATGFVYAIIAGKTLQQAMCIGAVNASFVTEFIGAQDGLIKRGELDEKMKRFAQYSPEIYNG